MGMNDEHSDALPAVGYGVGSSAVSSAREKRECTRYLMNCKRRRKGNDIGTVFNFSLISV